MTEKDIRERLSIIKKNGKRDPEHIHVMEDSLYKDFIRYVRSVMVEVAHDDKNLAVKAGLVLLALDIDYPRWCA
jgi:hypothetical protein